MSTIRHWAALAGGALGTAVILAGCGLPNVTGPAGAPPVGPPVKITQDVPASALVAIVGSPAAGVALNGLAAGTARPSEDLTVLPAGAPSRPLISSDSPAPAELVIPGRPLAPGGETTYQSAQYAKRLKHWQGELTTARRDDASQTRDAVSRWLRTLEIPAKTRSLADPPGSEESLAAESADAASALAGLDQGAGDIFGSRRVVVLYCRDLSGRLPSGELAGDKVIVITSFVPSVAAASSAQEELLAADAAQAAVLGPEITAARLAGLVSADLSQDTTPESVSAPLLFANGSAALLPGAVAELSKLLPRLRAADVTAVINGHASTPGTAQGNYTLSYQRAAAVAAFLESHGVPASSLIIVGHGTSDLVAPGSSALNRQVTVVIEQG